MPQVIGIPKEIAAGEKRVATVPEVVEKLVKLGFQVAVEAGAGNASNFSDDVYRAAGAEIIADAAGLWAGSDIVFKVRGPSADEVKLLREGGTLISFIWPAQNPDLMQQLAARKATVLAIDALPRVLSRAQKMDALTSQAGVAGYRAVIEAANAFGRFFNGQITAAGKVQPAKVFIAGAGVAGLAAIGTAASLGAIVRANDTRAEVADQVVSLGGEFVKVDYEEEGSGGGGYAKVMSEGFLQAQREMYAKQAREVDIIITTALIPGKPAPRLITAEMVQSMKPGSVIVDMAAEQGGNCELTEPGQAVVKHGVTIIGYTDLVSRLAKQSSTLNSRQRPPRDLPGRRRHTRPDGDQRRRDHLARTADQTGGTTACRSQTGRGLSLHKRSRSRWWWRPGLGDPHDHHVWYCRTAVLVDWHRRAERLPRPPHGVRAGVLHWLHGGVECHAGPAHAIDERHQCDLQHHRHRCTGADCAAAGRRHDAS